MSFQFSTSTFCTNWLDFYKPQCTVRLNNKIPPKIRLKKSRQTDACNSLTNFENETKMQLYIWNTLWNHVKLISFWPILAIWNHCSAQGRTKSYFIKKKYNRLLSSSKILKINFIFHKYFGEKDIGNIGFSFSDKPNRFQIIQPCSDWCFRSIVFSQLQLYKEYKYKHKYKYKF